MKNIGRELHSKKFANFIAELPDWFDKQGVTLIIKDWERDIFDYESCFSIIENRRPNMIFARVQFTSLLNKSYSKLSCL